MVGQGDRLKQIRKSQHLTQDGFAALLNISKYTVGSYELERLQLPTRTIKDICRLFNVNETWLCTGSGDMYNVLDREDEIAKIAAQIFDENDSDFRFKLQKLVSELDEGQLELLRDMAVKLAD